jgi:hypothetical protein
MEIKSNFFVWIIVIVTVDALSPAGVHLEITILAHINSLEIVDIFTLGGMEHTVFINNDKTIAE